MPLAYGSMEAGSRALVRVRTHVIEDLLELTEDGWDILLHRVPDNVGIHMTIVMHDPMANARDGGPRNIGIPSGPWSVEAPGGFPQDGEIPQDGIK